MKLRTKIALLAALWFWPEIAPFVNEALYRLSAALHERAASVFENVELLKGGNDDGNDN